jgi:hypothetical protein
MLIVGLAVIAMASDPRPPPPSDEAMLTQVTESVPGTEVLQSHDRPMPAGLDGARGVCGLARIDGRPQPFFVYTLWRPADALDGNRWATALRSPRSSEATFANNFERRGVLTACPDLIPPPGVDWPIALPSGTGVGIRSTARLDAEGRVVP